MTMPADAQQASGHRAEKPNVQRVVLAYSGGLDTSVAVRWIQEEWGAEVVALAVDVGQVPGADAPYWDALRERARAAGAIEARVVDAREEYANRYVANAIMANTLYEGKYPLVSALSRPVIARHLVAAAREFDADAVAHGCTGKGNDQVRFEVSLRTLAPDLEVLAPVRLWGFTRRDSIEYAARHHIPITASEDKPYSVDENIAGRAIECGAIEDPWNAPPDDIYERTRAVADAPREPREIVIGFERGVPVSLDGLPVPLHVMLPELDEIVGAYGFGRIDMVENRRVGIKSREIYECPGMLALMVAHADLESITLERDVMREKSHLEPRYAETVYDGLWYSPLREALDAFVQSTQRHVTGEVRLRLQAGRCDVVGRRAERGLYDYALATYEADDAFRHEDAAGFVRLWGLSLETWSKRQRVEEPTVPPDRRES
jgi:argininosuccinate synthase